MTALLKTDAADIAADYIERTPEAIGAGRASVVLDLARELAAWNADPADIMEAAEYANDTLCRPRLAAAEVAALVSAATGNGAALEHVTELVARAVAAEPTLSAEDLARLQAIGDEEAAKMRQAVTAAGLQSPAGLDPGALLRPDYLVKGWINRRTHALLFGKWNAGKTFAALHLCAHVAAGLPWFGTRVRQGGALYIGFEGAAGVPLRVHGLRQAYPHIDWYGLPFRWAHIAGALVREGGISGAPGREQFDAALEAFHAELGAYPSLIVVDPLRDAIGGAEEPNRVQPYLELMRSVIRETGATVLTLHHPGHANSDRARGDSGIVAAMDSEIRLEWDAKAELGKMVATKQRDAVKGYHYFTLDRVTLGTDTDGDEVTTLAVREAQAPGSDVKLTGQAAIAWATLGALEPGRELPTAEVLQLIRAAGLTQAQASRAIYKLTTTGLLERDGDAIRKPLTRAEPPDFEDE